MDDSTARLRESLYTVVGFGVLGIQQAQLLRRELQRELARLAVEVDEKVEPVLDDLEARLPDDLRPLLVQARTAARSAQRSFLGQSGPRSGDRGPSGPRSGDRGPSGPRSGDRGQSGPRSGDTGPSGPGSGDTGGGGVSG